ncbi:hypothetical protein [Phaeodactylibacter luteus]|nr:hypothetical protein [Phaeodactylibacter luteus]
MASNDGARIEARQKQIVDDLYKDYNDALFKYCLTFLKQEALS